MTNLVRTIIKKGNRNFVYETLTRKRPINKIILLVNYEIIEIEKKVAKFSLSFDYLRIQIHKVATTISIRGVLKLSSIFSNFVSYVCSIFALFSVMLVHMSIIYIDNISHFRWSVYFWQIKRLVVFWCALRFFTIRRNGSKKLYYLDDWALVLMSLPYTHDSPVMTFLSNSGSSLNVANISWAMCMRRCFCWKFSNFGTICAAAHLMPKISAKIVWLEPNDMPTSSATSLILIRQLSKIILFTALMVSSVVDMLGQPGHAFLAFLIPVIPQLNLCSTHSISPMTSRILYFKASINSGLST